MKKCATILLIDDDMISNMLTRIHIQDLAIAEQVIIATNGQQGIDYLTNNSPSSTDKTWPELILLDINMPIMDGFEFLEQFIELDLTNKPLVVILTTSNDSRDMEKGHQFNVAGYLPKPFAPHKLMSILQDLA
jgi:CheY-like chemotaxis protein